MWGKLKLVLGQGTDNRKTPEAPPVSEVFSLDWNVSSEDKFVVIHLAHPVLEYAIPQHSSKGADNYSNSSSEWTLRQEGEPIVSRIVS
jgi:hypothetical protein